MPGLVPVRKRGGERRTRVTFSESTTVKDSIGGQTAGEFDDFGADWAAIDEVPFIVNATEHGVLYKVTVKYRSDLVTKFETEKKRIRVTGSGKVLNVLELENPQRRSIELILHCAVA